LPTRLVPCEGLSIGGKDSREENMLLEPTDLDVDDDGNIYVLNRKAVHIKVCDNQDKFVRAIGRKGQGPGEFQSAVEKRQALNNRGGRRRLPLR
jgi:hypothetical protein